MSKNVINNPIISVIIPVYNREELINKTVMSVINQPCFESVEIVFVNDGSVDNSQAICESFTEKYNNIKLINQPNGGVASARNTGIENATGKYISFLDCDDWWNNGFFDEILLYELDNNDFNIYGFSYCDTNSNCKYYRIHHVAEKEEFYENNQLGRYNWLPHCSFIYLRKFLIRYHDLRYPNIKLLEDRCFCERCFYLAKSYKSIDKCIFTYWLNSNSAVHNVDCKTSFSENYKGFCLNQEWFEKYGEKYDITYSVCMLFCTYIKLLCCEYNYNQVKKTVKTDKRLLPILEYKSIGLQEPYYSTINKWMLHPFLFFLKCRIKEKPVLLAKKWLMKRNGILRDFCEFIEFRIIRHYNAKKVNDFEAL